MVKQKIHTARNQTFKAHRNGIKKPKKHRYRATKGMDPKFLRNARHALAGTRSAVKKQRKHRANAAEDLQALISSSGGGGITLASGRVIPAHLCGGEMISVTNRNVMRLLLHNQAVLAGLFEEYAVDGDSEPNRSGSAFRFFHSPNSFSHSDDARCEQVPWLLDAVVFGFCSALRPLSIP